MPSDRGITGINSSSIKTAKADAEKSQSQVDNEYFNQIGILVDEYLHEQKSFVQPGYNMNQLVDDMSLPIHHLSYYFREIRKQNFTDYKNELRVKHACELIQNEEFKEITLEAIGEKAGFSSRITFMRAFKKVTNQTPGNYKISMEQTSREKIG
jgi:AraC-like DNA-binding protein